MTAPEQCLGAISIYGGRGNGKILVRRWRVSMIRLRQTDRLLLENFDRIKLFHRLSGLMKNRSHITRKFLNNRQELIVSLHQNKKYYRFT